MASSADCPEWRRRTTLAALCAISAVKGADLQLLPASFRAMEVDLQLKPYALGTLALCQGVACACAGPFWGNLVDSGLSRKMLLTAGTGLWGACTLMLAFVSDFRLMALLRVFNGASLAMLLPVVQSFVVDLSKESERGYVFGWLYFFSNIGQVISCLFVTPTSNQIVWGLDGWRAALAAVGLVSWAIMLLVPAMITEEPRVWKPERVGFSKEFRKIVRFMRVPTFAVIILQGIFGTIPGAALSFSTMYFQYMGIPDSMCALINSLRIIGEACGGLLGGLIGDVLATRSPAYGRPLTAQISIILCLPFMYAIFIAVPRVQSMTATYAGLLFLHGLAGSWVAPGCICPVMCEIVPKRSLASAYAWEMALVFASGNSIGPVLVGVMSQQLFGYRLSTQQVGSMSPAARRQNAEALGKSLFLSSALPYAICAGLFTLLYLTYTHDVRKATESEGSDSGDWSSSGDRIPEGSSPQVSENTKLLKPSRSRV